MGIATTASSGTSADHDNEEGEKEQPRLGQEGGELLQEALNASISSGTECDQLLPGIVNAVTLNHIVPKLAWRDCRALPMVSRRWRRAFQEYEFHSARIFSRSAESLVLLNFGRTSEEGVLVLHSIEDGHCYELPPIPGVKGGVPQSSECVFVDGKVYVLGGLAQAVTRSEVYVFDLGGRGRWRQCASMLQARREFGCGVLDGKIYVFGGTSDCTLVWGSEVYDPEKDVWLKIKPMRVFRVESSVTSVGDELFLHGGKICEPAIEDRSRLGEIFVEELLGFYGRSKEALFAHVYHPGKDEWRKVPDFTSDLIDRAVMVGGMLYRVTDRGVQAYDIDANSWDPPQPFSFAGAEFGDSFSVVPISATAFADKILALVSVCVTGEYQRPCLILSQSVTGAREDITWKSLQFRISPSQFTYPSLCAVNL